MKRFYLVCFLLFQVLVSEAQFIPLNRRAYIDSLNAVLKSNATDSSKAVASFHLVEYWRKTDTSKAQAYLKRGRLLAKDNGYLQALYQYNIGQLYFPTDKIKSKTAYLKADTLLNGINTKTAFLLKAKLWHNYSIMLQMDNDYKSLVYILLNKVVPFAQLAGENGYVGMTYVDVGIIFENQRDNSKATMYFEKAIESLKSAHVSSSNRVYAYISAAQNYLEYDKLSLAKKWLDSTKVWLAGYSKSEYFLDYYLVEGQYLKKIKQFEKSINSLNKGIALAEELNMLYYKETLLHQKYKVFTLKGQYKQAKQIMLEILQNTKVPLLENRLLYYQEISETYENLGEVAEAYQWLKKYSSLSDSVNNSKLKVDINELETKYRSAENERKITALNATNQKARLDAKNSSLLNWLLASASLFLLVVVILGFFFYRNNQKLSAQKEQAKITQAMLQGQEDERIRMARDLHDGLGGMLANVKFNLSGFAGDKEKNNDIELLNIIHQLDNSVGELRRIAHNLMPEMLLKLGLEASLRDLCESLIAENFGVDFQCLGISKIILTQQQIAIYRIVQELLANVVKHANARNLFLQCSQTAGVFFITIEDDGKGFNPEQQNEKQGIGLSNIKSRVAYLNGKMEVLSKAGHPGTSINIELNVTS